MKGQGSDGPIEELRRLTQWVRHVSDQADAKIGAVNELIRDLGAMGWQSGAVVLGAVIHEREYQPAPGGHSSAQFVQAAVFVPEGFGVVLWDSDDFTIRREMPGEPEAAAARGFVPYRSCEPLLRGLLLAQVGPLVAKLLAGAR